MGSNAPAEPRSPTHADLVFVARPQRDLKLDLYLPDPSHPRPIPTILWFHGGGWRNGDKGEPWLIDLVEQGFAIVDAQYRKTDEAPAPANIQDCRAAIRWVRTIGAQTYGLDPARVGVSGGSAGGHLALLCGAPPNTPGLTEDSCTDLPVQAILDCCGVSHIPSLWIDPQHERYHDFVGLVELLLDGPLAQKQELAHLISPLNHVRQDFPPTYVLHGARDTVVLPDQGTRFVAAMQAAGAPVIHHQIPDGVHSRPSIWTDDAPQRILAFFQRHLAQSAS